jgi:hypothetical protein
MTGRAIKRRYHPWVMGFQQGEYLMAGKISTKGGVLIGWIFHPR